MIDSNLKIKIKDRDRLYFDRFRYCLHVSVQDIECLRNFSKTSMTFPTFAQDIIVQINRRAARAKFWGSNWDVAYTKDNLLGTINALNDLTITLWPHKSDIKLSLSGSLGYLYTNNLEILEEISRKSYVRTFYCNEAAVTRPRNAIELIQSNYSMRSYLKERKMSLDQKKILSDFLKNQEDIHVTPSLKFWLDKNDRFWTRNYFFIDHNSELIITMLGLVSPGIIGRTLPIVLKDK